MLIAGRELNFVQKIKEWGDTLTALVAIAAAMAYAAQHFQSADEAKRTAAWASVRDANQTVLILRNRVNDCDVRRKQAEPLGRIEDAACKQYDDEFDAARAASKQAIEYAKALSR